MKKLISVLLTAVILICSVSVGVLCFAENAEATTAVESVEEETTTRIDLTQGGGEDHTTFWRIFAQLWIDLYYFFVDIIAMIRS